MSVEALPPPTPRRLLPRRFSAIPPAYWLALAIVAYFAVSLSLSWIRALDLDTTTWDQGIYQQALWSTAHGRPFWEAADAETGGYGSFLQVHSVFLLYLLVPLYAAAPSEVTLFAVQSAVVALAAVPLYLLGRDLTGSRRWGLADGLVYLAWAPLLAANLYDFHAESFLPIEIFSFVLLWNRGRYGWGFVVAALSFLTFELAPILLFFVGVFFLLPDRQRWIAGVHSLRSALALGQLARWLRSGIRQMVRTPRVLATVTLLVACAVSYVFLLLLREQYLHEWLGFSPFPSAVRSYVVGETPAALGLAWGNLEVGFAFKVLMWLVIFALLGFVPLLAPRALVIALPWLAFTFFSSNLNYVTIGFQYGFIVAASLFVAFTYGLVPLDQWRKRVAARAVSTGTVERPRAPLRTSARRTHRQPLVTTLLIVALAGLVAVNVAASPVDPVLDNIGLGSGYTLHVPLESGYGSAEAVAALIPSGASVIASDNLFPLVANDVHAYSFLWTWDPFLTLPFNSTHLPSFVFISESRIEAVPSWINATLYTASDYGSGGWRGRRRRVPCCSSRSTTPGPWRSSVPFRRRAGCTMVPRSTRTRTRERPWSPEAPTLRSSRVVRPVSVRSGRGRR